MDMVRKKTEANALGPFFSRKITVGLVAPSYKVYGETFEKSITRLSDLGFSVVSFDPFPTVLKWSGTVEQRGLQINKMFADPEVDIVWAMRGGLASLGVIPHIDIECIKSNKKLFVGYSDITSLQIAFLELAQLPSLQYYMPGSKNWFSEDSASDVLFFNQILDGKSFSEPLSVDNIFVEGTTSGTIVGGCLDLVCSSLGTPHELKTDDMILYLEDANIPPQRLFNDLYHLYNAGKFDKLKGLVIARIYNCPDYYDFLMNFLEEMDFSFPVVIEFESGHTARKVPVPLGGNCTIDTSKKLISFEMPVFKSPEQ